MNPLDDKLDRLFRATKAEPVGLVSPYGLETRVLAAWRERKLSGWWNPLLLSRGLGLACLLMLLSLLPLYKATKVNPVADYLQLADSTEQVGGVNP